MPTSRARLSRDEIYELLVMDEENPVALRFYYRKDAEQFQRQFYVGLEDHNLHIYSKIQILPVRELREEVVLFFWK